MRGARRARRAAAGWTAALLALAACDPGASDGDPSGTPDPAATAADAGDTGDADERPDADAEVELPDVAFLDPAEVVEPDDPATLDGAVASAAEELPGGWVVAVVPDPSLGPYVVGLPEGATVWRVGEEVAPLTDAAADASWVRYWEPVLADASEAADGSSLRSVVVLPAAAADGVELHLTLSATSQQDLPVDDPAAVADRFAESFRQQRLEVEEATTARAGDDEVAAITVTTPEDEFDDGVPRRLRQWFYPETGSPVLWSVTCEAPAPDVAAADAVCPVVLASFRTPPR